MTDAVIEGAPAPAADAAPAPDPVAAAPAADPAPAPEAAATDTPAEGAEPELVLEAPEGMDLDADAVTEFGALAKELGLDKANAQRVADIAIKMQQRAVEQHQETVSVWADQARADKEFGGDKFDASMATAKRALTEFGSPELLAVLESSGLGNHPDMVRAFYRIGKAIGDDSFVPGRQGAPEKPVANRMFPTMN